MDTQDLTHQWDRLDKELERQINLLCPHTSDNLPILATLKLPLRHGGLGILDHQNIAPHARAAYMSESDTVLAGIFPPSDPDALLAPPTAQEPTSTQHQRCKPMWDAQLEEIINQTTPQAGLLLAEAAAPLGRRWLSTIPYFQSLRLDNHEVATGLHHRLLRTSHPICNWCGASNRPGHDEICRERPRRTVARHDAIVRTLGRALTTLPLAQVATEPHTFEGRRRNDLRLQGARFTPSIDYDIIVYSILGANGPSLATTNPPTNPPISPVAHMTNKALNFLDSIAHTTNDSQPLAPGAFKPLVFSTGGLMARATAEELKKWQTELEPPVWDRMMTQLSLELLRARSRSFAMGRGASHDNLL